MTRLPELSQLTTYLESVSRMALYGKKSVSSASFGKGVPMIGTKGKTSRSRGSLRRNPAVLRAAEAAAESAAEPDDEGKDFRLQQQSGGEVDFREPQQSDGEADLGKLQQSGRKADCRGLQQSGGKADCRGLQHSGRSGSVGNENSGIGLPGREKGRETGRRSSAGTFHDLAGGDWRDADGLPDNQEQMVAALQRAVVWSEILGQPVSKRRRRKRMGDQYGNQGHARRR